MTPQKNEGAFSIQRHVFLYFFLMCQSFSFKYLKGIECLPQNQIL